VGISKQITILMSYQVTSGILTFIKFHNISMYVSDIFVLTVCFKLINSVSQTFPFFFKFYYFHILHCSKRHYLFCLHFSPASFDLIILSTFHQTMVYVVATHNNLESQ